MEFIPINLNEHKEVMIEFRKDSFIASFGHSDDFDTAEYLTWVENKIKDHPDGFVLIRDDATYIGKLELTTKEYKGERIGYINLYYLVESHRGKGYGKLIHDYAKNYFRQLKVDEFHLRVSPTNHQAIKFYERNGLEQLSKEHDGKVIRMRGFI